MPQKMFLKLDGIRGESQSPRHIGEIEIAGFVCGEPESGPGVSAGGSGGSGKALLNELIVFKEHDKASPFLRVAAAEGRHINEGALTVEKISESGGLLHTFIINLRSILIQFVTLSENSGLGPIETVELNFRGKEFVRS